MIYEHKDMLGDLDLTGKVIFTNGCFDILHAGHTSYLSEAKALGDILIIGLNDDDSVRRLKGSDRPINTWKDRAAVLAALRYVDVVVGFEEDTPLELIKKIRPAVITKGGDYKKEDMIGRSFVEGYGGEVVILPFLPGYSTTDIISKMNG